MGEQSQVLDKPVAKQPLMNLKEYPVEDAFELRREEIAELAERYLPLTVAEDGTGLDEVHAARMDVKGRRVAVDKRGKQLRADTNAFSKRVIACVKELTDLMAPIESHLLEQESAYKERQEQIKREAEAKRQKILRGKVDALAQYGVAATTYEIEEMGDAAFDEWLGAARTRYEERMKREAEERAEQERLEAERIAEQKRIEAEQAAERERLEAERAEAERIAAEQRRVEEERLRVERERLEAERQKQEAERAAIEAERRRLEEEARERERQAEAERQRKEAEERARQEERERIEREQREAEERAAAEEAARKRAEALRPDKEKLWNLAESFESMEIPEFNEPSIGPRVEDVLAICANEIRKIADALK